MRVVFPVAGFAFVRNADLGRRSEMTGFAAHLRMFSEQRKCRPAMIEFSDLPIVGAMAGAAALAQAAVMHIVFLMA